jgi:hypothetical protein
MKEEPIRQPVRVFRRGPRCTAIKCEECNHDQEDIAGKQTLEPPLHDSCDCMVIGLSDGTACCVCRTTLEVGETLGIGIQVKKPSKVDPKKEEVVEVVVCADCIFVLYNIINSMMQDGAWNQVVAIAQKKLARPGGIIVPQNKIVRPN